MTVPRTDLALEAADDLAARTKKNSPPEGIRRLESLQEGYAVTDIRITNDAGAQALGKPVGRYITVDLRPYCDRQRTFFHRAVWCIAQQLRALLPDAGPRSQILVAGLGNRAMTPDALGPAAVENLLVTRHMVRTLPRQFRGFTPVSALCTGVLARTGLETLELIQGAAAHIRPTAVIAIDALAAFESERICTTVQITDTGIEPGSGVGNHRLGLTEETLGVKVIAVGVPMVVYASTIARDAMARLIDEYGLLARGHEEAAQQLLRQVSEGFLGDMVVTPREIDELVLHVAALLSDGINQALQPDIDPDTLHTYIQG